MFSRWGAFIYRRRRPVVLLTVLVAVASIAFATRASDNLTGGGFLDPSSESAKVADRIAADYGGGRSSLIALFRGSGGAFADMTGEASQAAIEQALAGLRSNSSVSGVTGYAQTGDRRFISAKGDAAYVVIGLTVDDDGALDILDELTGAIVAPPGLIVQLTGYAPLTRDSNEQAEKDLSRAELVSLPLAAIILIAVFGSLVAASLPMLVAGLAIPSALAVVYFVAQAVEMSTYVLNVATMLGLAFAIDYSLFLVSRFREELNRGRSVEQAVERAVATSGKAVAFSGIAVAIGLSGLLLFRPTFITSIGIGSGIVVLTSVGFALTFLPAALGMLGPRVNSLSVRHLTSRLRGPGRDRSTQDASVVTGSGSGWWERVARAVMAHPWRVLVPVLAFLLVLGAPVLRLVQGVPGAEVLPAGRESRDAIVALNAEFQPGDTTPIVLLATVQGDPTSPENVRALAEYAAAVAAMEGIDRVESPFSGLTNPATGAPLTVDEIVALYSLPAAQRPPQVAALLDAYVAGSTVRLDAISPIQASLPGATSLIPHVRGLETGERISVEVGGAAALGADFLAGQAQRLPWAVAWTLLASIVILFLLFGSVVLPIKAVVMTLLSITASFGALVWIFQEGNLSGELNFQPLGYTVAGVPIIMFSVIFGLSMDYEVLLLSRIQEAYRRTNDNTASVAEGLARTAGVITGAALIMVAVFAAFALADVITIKSIGIGMAIAVLLDATVIRVLLVPATMRLMGRWNWWAPGPLRRLADRLGFSHVEDDPADLTGGPLPVAGAAGR